MAGNRPRGAWMPALLLSVITAAVLAACGGDGSSTDSSSGGTGNGGNGGTSVAPKAVTGVFLDAAVEGLEYAVGPNGVRSLTDAAGTFSYQPGDQLCFFVGKTALGCVKGGAKLTLTDFEADGAMSQRVVNMARLLQSLDADGDPDNGIQLDAAARDALKAVALNLADKAGLEAAFQPGGALAGRTLRDEDAAREHYESTLAGEFGRDSTTLVDGIAVTKLVADAPRKFYVPYKGDDAGIKKAFPNGFPISLGSGIAFKGKDTDGGLLFYVLTDRGPNGDAPDYNNGTSVTKSKVFPVPAFNPQFGVLKVKNQRAALISMTPLRNEDGSAATGLPPAPGKIGSTLETPLTEALKATLPYDDNGIDPEGVAIDPDGKHLWFCDEYGPYLFKVEIATGKIVTRLAPKAGLPDVLQYRQPNRGFEGVALTPSGKVMGAIQSILEIPEAKDSDGVKQKTSKSPFIRLVEYDPATKTSRMLAYPHDVAGYAKSKDAKLGDIVALSDTRFLVVEQGAQTDGIVHNMIYLVDTAGATDLSGKLVKGLEPEYQTTLAAMTGAGIMPVRKTLLFDMKKKDASGRLAFGWLAEKLEGLTVVDNRTIAIANDNDFGVAAAVVGADGKSIKADDCTVDAAGVLSGSKCVGTAPLRYQLGRGADAERPSRLWLIRLPKALSDYAVN